MKITTVPSNFGKKLSVLNGIELSFNHLGECEVEEEIGIKLLEKYPETFTDPSSKVTNEVKPKVNSFQAKVISNLEKEMASLKDEVTAKENLIKEAVADKEAWSTLAVEAKEKLVLAEAALETEKAVNLKLVQGLEYKIQLLETPFDKLKKSLEKSDYPKNEWESLDQKQLIEYLLGKN